jgi:hypothetical protein
MQFRFGKSAGSLAVHADRRKMDKASNLELFASGKEVRNEKDPSLRKQIGSRAKESVRQKFLMSRLLEDWLDLLCRYERPVI